MRPLAAQQAERAASLNYIDNGLAWEAWWRLGGRCGCLLGGSNFWEGSTWHLMEGQRGEEACKWPLYMAIKGGYAGTALARSAFAAFRPNGHRSRTRREPNIK